MSNSTPKVSKPLTYLMLFLATLTGILTVWRLDHQTSTDDAFAYADTISVAPEVEGRIEHLAVKENQYVKKGQLLFQLDSREYQEQLAKAQASLNELNQEIMLSQRSVNAQKYSADSSSADVRQAQADLVRTTATLNRILPLYKSGVESGETLDETRTAQQAAQAALESALQKAKSTKAGISGVDALVAQRAVIAADIALAKLNLEYSTLRAPADGWVTGLTTREGEYAKVGDKIFSVIDASHWYVVASFRETELPQIHAGLPTDVWLMSDTGRKLHGTVDSIGFGVVPTEGSIGTDGLPSIPRELNWVRVSQRFPVRIRIDNPPPNFFRLGASAMVAVNA
ncbi:biotin/lipoyl-binding protein [Shimwellia pseudoproteus]|uniref:efflux RND transporter periplasmic adaptor subunit n=1 Tax=Shimwellia pseudoproteus TaxID=570012 RepID=UPI0018ED0316|nr:biotin/lipoyl-binding protein [Shimwellia pseudoproteus]MBJ3816392.1 biotin/lipoyl-binding protein [Shimwellia pseudoproteus]